MSTREVYEKTERSILGRYKTRGTYDQDTIHSIIDSAPVLHVSFTPTSFEDDPFPTILPMLGCTGSYTLPNATEISATAIYLHGHASSRIMKLHNSSHVQENSLPGVPVCVAATHIDGIVMALTPFNHSCNYRSAVVHGYANIVDDPAEKMYALKLMTDNLIQDRWNNSRVPPTEAEMKSTGVLRVEIVSASGKTRAGPPGNDKIDLDDQDMRKRVWTGTVPVYTRYGEPVPAKENEVVEVPSYIMKWIDRENKGGDEYSKKILM